MFRNAFIPALLLAAVACAPAAAQDTAAAPAGDTIPVLEVEAVERRPQLKNRRAVGRTLELNYPPELRERGIGGDTRVRFLVDETGETREARVVRSSGYVEIDAAARRVAAAMKFTPAVHHGRAARVWVTIPISFRTSDGPGS